MNHWKGLDLISINDFSREMIEEMLDITDRLRAMDYHARRRLLKGKVMASLFFEASTRTRTSFHMAMMRLGGRVEGISDTTSTSVSKGESLWDTIKIYANYDFNVIVLRHPIKGAARLASEAADIPIVNAGDGSNQHPTQTLLDLYTIRESQNKIDGIKIAFVGDLRYGRTVHSLVDALCLFEGCKFYFVSPSDLSIPHAYREKCRTQGVSFEDPDRIEDVIDEVDILFMTRVQKERIKDKFVYEKVKDVYSLNASMLSNVKANLKIMHPLPRVTEISKDVDDTPYAYYFQQAKNGLHVRQAVLASILGCLTPAPR